jgi:hypothetical protein
MLRPPVSGIYPRISVTAGRMTPPEDARAPFSGRKTSVRECRLALFGILHLLALIQISNGTPYRVGLTAELVEIHFALWLAESHDSTSAMLPRRTSTTLRVADALDEAHSRGIMGFVTWCSARSRTCPPDLGPFGSLLPSRCRAGRRFSEALPSQAAVPVEIGGRIDPYSDPT